jgi:alpha-tubulin suppressor-like RCC1 family protein
VVLDNTLWCWGSNFFGELGLGTKSGGPKKSPVQVKAPHGTNVAEVTAGWRYTCIRKMDRTVWCWGDNGHGQLGNKEDDPLKANPVQVTSLGIDTVQLVAGTWHTCARKGDHTLWCWGWNQYGQLGDGTKEGEGDLCAADASRNCRLTPVRARVTCLP